MGLEEEFEKLVSIMHRHVEDFMSARRLTRDEADKLHEMINERVLGNINEDPELRKERRAKALADLEDPDSWEPYETPAWESSSRLCPWESGYQTKEVSKKEEDK